MSHDPNRTDLPRPSELMGLLEIDFEEIGPTRVSGSVAADERHHQPWGLVHGGPYPTVKSPSPPPAPTRR